MKNNFDVKLESNCDQLKTNIKIYKDKKIIFSKKLNALSDEGIVSLTGKYFFIQLFRSDHEDSNKGFLFDLITGNVLFSRILECGTRGKFYFDNLDRLFISTKYGEFEIDQNGEIPNIEGYYRNYLNAGGEDSIYLLKRYLEKQNFSQDACDLVINSIDKTIPLLFDTFHGASSGAEVFKIRAELLEKNEQYEEALQSYVNARFLNNKIAVKRKISNLCKKLNTDMDKLIASEIVQKLLKNNIKTRELEMEQSRKAREVYFNQIG